MAEITIPRGMRAMDREEIAADNTVKTLTAAKIFPATGTHAQAAVLKCVTQPIRFTLDGTDPAAATGMTLAAGDVLTLSDPGDMKAMEFIREGGTNGELQVIYCR